VRHFFIELAKFRILHTNWNAANDNDQDVGERWALVGAHGARVVVIAKLDGELNDDANQNRPDARRANDGQNLRASSNFTFGAREGKR
jgi:hypothetical protein